MPVPLSQDLRIVTKDFGNSPHRDTSSKHRRRSRVPQVMRHHGPDARTLSSRLDHSLQEVRLTDRTTVGVGEYERLGIKPVREPIHVVCQNATKLRADRDKTKTTLRLRGP